MGVPADQVADCLGVTVGSLNARAARGDSLVDPATIKRLTGLTPASIGRRSGVGLCPASATGPADVFKIGDIVRALQALPH